MFNEGQEDHKLRLKGNRASNDGDIVRRWCVAGQGLAIKSCLDMSEDLLAGNVVNVLPQYKPMPTELWLICPSRQSITPTVRLLRDLFRSKTRVILENLVDRGFVDKANLS
ncbi:transcriptional regulator LysR family [Vibrio variabilis]|uniref:Transcriptional regulator LysR family n=1 Tax=Vibrio variabilis TaxID=990271 RepID=A0ABQ0JE19_9VIBR|nr:transcriptional regulator LysR family [Vibrio variabilis]